MMLQTTVRKVNVIWESSGYVFPALREIAERVSAGVHHRTQSGETDEQFLERVADEIRRDFLAEAGEATGADGFSFAATLAE